MSHIPWQIRHHYQEAFHHEEEELGDTPILGPSGDEGSFIRDEAQIRRDEDRAQDEYMATFFGNSDFGAKNDITTTNPR